MCDPFTAAEVVGETVLADAAAETAAATVADAVAGTAIADAGATAIEIGATATATEAAAATPAWLVAEQAAAPVADAIITSGAAAGMTVAEASAAGLMGGPSEVSTTMGVLKDAFTVGKELASTASTINSVSNLLNGTGGGVAPGARTTVITGSGSHGTAPLVISVPMSSNSNQGQALTQADQAKQRAAVVQQSDTSSGSTPDLTAAILGALWLVFFAIKH